MPPKNPWEKISRKNTIADCDRSLVQPYLIGLSKRIVNQQIHNELLPEPFLGNLNANVYLLNGNPGYSPQDSLATNDSLFESEIQKTLKQNSGTAPTSFLWLDSAFRFYPGAIWWRKKLNQVLKIKSNPKICVVEYFPYHTENLPKLISLPSNNYLDWYINDAIDKKKNIVIMRCASEWIARIPKLSNYNYFMCSNTRNVSITEGNLLYKNGRLISHSDWINLIKAM